ncbi:hypothetical protein LINGRAHAP2_LOCUS20665 [Linum grandiflorum]
MYRPFVTCEDPKGVVECGTIRKSRSHNKIGRSHRHKKKNSAAGEHHPNPSSFQLMEVSKGGAKKAEDLLKGALHLKDSLVMLGKLQDASDYMAKLKQKQLKEKERERVVIDDDGFPSVMMRRATSCREDPTFQMMGFQKPRLSVDGGDYIDELRMAITDSFDRQNLLSLEERASLLHMRRTRDQDESITKSIDLTSKVLQKKKDKSSSTSSNLIARLMGLEDIQPPAPMCAQKRMDTDVPNPNVRKLKQKKEDYFFNMKEAETQQRSLRDLLETMEFRGLLKKSSSVKKYTTNHQSNYDQQLLPEGIPPVVLIKPFYMPESEFSSEDEFLRSTDVIIRKVEVKDENFTPGRSCKEGGFLEASSNIEVRAKNHRGKRIGKEEEQVKTVVKGKNRMPREDAGGKSAAGKGRACKEHKDTVQRVKDGVKSNAKVIVDKTPEVKETLKVRNGSARIEDDKTKVATFREVRDSASGRIGSRSQRVEQQSGTRNAKAKKKRKSEDEKEKVVDEVKEKIVQPEHKEVDLIEPVVEGSIPTTSGSQQTFREEETNSSAFPLEEHCTKTYSSPTPECGKHLHFKTSKAEDSNLRLRIQFKTFLLSSREFLNPIMTSTSSSFPTPNTSLAASRADDSATSLCTKLSLDYANELIEWRSSNNLDEVVEQVCNGIDALKHYHKLNSVSAILERDLKSTGVMVSQVWESGWRNGLCTTEEAVFELEKLILDHLIEEVFT